MSAAAQIPLPSFLARARVVPFLVVAASAQQSVPFGAHIEQAAGVRRVIAADLDVDGDVDLVNTTGNQLQVRWNLGGGVLAAPAALGVGTDARDVVAADWDGDGDLDLFAANFGSGNVSARRKVSGTNYAAAGTFAAGSSPSAISAGDLDGNGLLDLVVANYSPQTVSVLLGTSATTFAAPVAYPIGGIGYELELVDLDADGKLDIATANLTGQGLSVLLGTGSGTFAPASSWGSSAYDVEPADLDHDGDLDLALATTQARSSGYVLSVRWNQGGSFASSASFIVGSQPTSLVSGDFDGDLDADVGVTCYGESNFEVLSAASGSLTTTDYVIVGQHVDDSTIADVDGDGWRDLVVANNYDGVIGVFGGRGNGTFADSTSSFHVGAVADDALSADFTGDGVRDLVVRGGIQLNLLAGLGNGAFGAPVAVAGGPLATAAIGDVDGDLDVDIVGTAGSPPQVRALLNDGTGNFTSVPSPAANVTFAGARLGDMDGDQDLDLVLAQDWIAANVYVHLNLGAGTFASPATYAASGAAYSLVLANLDAHPALDVAVVLGNGARVHFNNGSGVLSSTFGSFSGGQDITAGDLDGDGDVDLAMADISSGRLNRLLNDGNGTFTSAFDYQLNQPWRVASGDFDGDGDVDLMTGDYDGSITLRENLGGGSFAAPVLLPLKSLPNDVGFADVDGDSDLDVLAVMDAVTPTGDTVTIHFNTTLEPPHVYCASQTTSNGCVPSIGHSGLPSASSAAPFTIQVANLRNQKAGLLFYGYRAKATPFQGGTLCVAAPTRRTPVQSSGGSASPASDCTGTFALDFNAWIQSGVDPALVVGATVDAQHWSRDPGGPVSNTALSDALHFRVRP